MASKNDDDDNDDRGRRGRRKDVEHVVENQLNMFRNYELRTIAAPKTVACLPTVLVLGHLGSGKTTVLKHVLTQTQNDLKVVVAVNDYAAVNVDAEIVKRTLREEGKEEVMELTNGCVCCSLNGHRKGRVECIEKRPSGSGGVFVRGDKRNRQSDGFSVEFRKAFGKFARIRLDCVCCVVDAEVAENGGPEYEREAWFAQIRASDAVFLNKVDLLDGDTEARLELAITNVRKAFATTKDGDCDLSANDDVVKIVPIERGRLTSKRHRRAYDIFEPEGKQGTDLGSARKRLVVNDYGESLSSLGKLRVNKTEKKKPSVSGPLKLGRHSKTFKTSYASTGDKKEVIRDAVDFETLEMIDFVQFQRWIRKSNVARAKGMVRFATVNGLWDVSVSGRGRVEVTPIEAKFALPGINWLLLETN